MPPLTPVNQGAREDNFSIQVPSLSLSKGGGAIKNIDEQFRVNAVNGTCSFSLPIPVSPARGEMSPSLSLAYNSGSGNGCFGLGWSCDCMAIQRRTDKKIPDYRDADESDIFQITGSEDLVPLLSKDGGGNWVLDEFTAATGETVRRYRPRIEGSFNRIERITPKDSTVFYWRHTTIKNVVTIFGRSQPARIADPDNPNHIFKWLPEFSFDDRGNCLQYSYLPENLTGVTGQLHEQNRLNGSALFANTYLQNISYGNLEPYSIDPSAAYNPLLPVNPQYLFQIVFDYGDHDPNTPIPAVQLDWPVRLDPFSDYHAGFEIRTYRLCQRVLIFHYFRELGDGQNHSPVLVRSVDLGYRYFNNPGASSQEKRNAETDFMISIQQSGYLKKGALYSRKSLPSFSMTYQEPVWNTDVQEISAKNAENDPVGIGDNYQWLDLWSEGISGILSEQGNGWFFKSNLGQGQFTPAAPVFPKPSFTGLSGSRLQLQELESDGRKFIVCLEEPAKGYFELGDDGSWHPYESFENTPVIDLKDPDTRMIDLNGDGRPDIIISGETVFTWFGNAGMEGYNPAEYAPKPADEEQGPALVFRDPLETIFLADMSGDGLTDIVRIRNGEICYWPNRGYGRFGAKVNMGNAPVFDNPDLFNPAYIHLADISGTGPADLLYLGKGSFSAWINLSGNGWSDTVTLSGFPVSSSLDTLSVADFLGSGTACIVWSSPLPRSEDAPLRYIDLMKGKKPYLLSSYANGMGKQVDLAYSCSTSFYLQDKLEGKPWITKLPFPVHCISQLTVNDLAAGLRMVSTYSYHHGYYDHAEKEFRGFGRVEQTDTEDISNFKLNGSNNVVSDDLQQEPVKTISWFHTGAYLGLDRILDQYAQEYNKGPNEFDLPQPVLPGALSPLESREALRSCKGMTLRQETYGLDGSLLQTTPYSVSINAWQIRLLQPKRERAYAGFFTFKSEGASFTYERNFSDPRSEHTLNLEVDDTGHILQAASVSYSRKLTDPTLPAAVQNAQQKINTAYTVNGVTNAFDTSATYRLAQPAESFSYDLTGIMPGNGKSFTLSELSNLFGTASLLFFEQAANNISPQKRLVGDQRSIYLKNDLVADLPLGQIDTLAFNSQQYRMAFTPGLVTHLYGSKIGSANLTGANYIQHDGVNWWTVSGKNLYIQGLETVSDASKRFYIPVVTEDNLGSLTQLSYDSYSLVLTGIQDAKLNVSTVGAIDYRTLKPTRITDINQNISELLLDELGMVIATSIYGKEGDGAHGDKPLSSYNIIKPAGLADVISNPLTYLQQATSFFYYDLDAWQNSASPVCFAAVNRQTHVSDLAEAATTKVFLSVGYSSGSGFSLQTKLQADPGPALKWSGNNLVTVDTSPNLRWVGSGRTIFNNKGNPVKQYEPFFSTTFAYESEAALVEIGFSSIIYYDPLNRVVLTQRPNGTFSKIDLAVWKQLIYDENDTVLDSSWYADRGSPNPLSPEPADPQTRAAWLAAKHANTPTETHIDSMGRIILTVSNNGPSGNYNNFSSLDILGNVLAITDARNNTVMTWDYDMLGRKAHQLGMDSGDRWVFPDISGRPIHDFTSNTDNGGQTINLDIRHEYDEIHRPTNIWLVSSGPEGTTTFLVGVNVYGETQPQDTTLNLRGKLYEQYDQSGLIQTAEYDFKGNIKRTFKELALEYTKAFSWDVADRSTLLDPTRLYRSSFRFDASNKPVQLVTPDGSTVSPAYNDSNYLNSLQAFVQSRATTVSFVQQIDYNAKGQRERIVYGNNSSTGYTYEDTTYRLVRILTTRNKGAEKLQDLNYTYDPVGNITQAVDQAQQTLFFNNSGVDPSSKYEYDAIYRLVHAWGREHAGQNAASDQFDEDKSMAGGNRLVLPGDIAAMQNFEEIYQYDVAGNFLQMVHNAGSGIFSNKWTRVFAPAANNNQLQSAQVSGQTTNYHFDAHGNLLNLQNGTFGVTWNYADQLQQMDLGGGGTAFYVYDNSGQRVRKVIVSETITKERIYLGGFEIYHEIQANTINLERQTLHLMDDKKRIAMIETRTIGTDPGEAFLIRFQYGNQLGSACLELQGNPDPSNSSFNPSIISYEEYYPFGSTSYQAMDNQTETAKRYRYSGKERDGESGLYYYGARYYIAWLARWSAPDPIGIADGLNLYAFVSDNPVTRADENGTDGNGAAENNYHLHLDPKLIAEYNALLARRNLTTVTVSDASGKVVSTSTTDDKTQGSDASSSSGDASGTETRELKPPSFLATSIGQNWQAIDPLMWVLEFNLNLGGVKSLRELGDVGGGLNTYYGSIRRGYTLGRLKGDIGGFASINATASTSGTNVGGSTGLILHNQLELGDDLGLGLYLTPALQVGPYTAGGFTATGVFGKEPDTGKNKDLNLSGGYFNKGQFADPASPLFGDFFFFSLLLSKGYTVKSPSKSRSDEIYLNYYHGSRTAQPDQSPAATGNAFRFGYGHNWQFNWKQGEEQYNGAGLYLGGAVEVDIISRDPTAGGPARTDVVPVFLFFGSISIGASKW